MLQLQEISRYRDGGTIHCIDAAGREYYIDYRIGTQTPGVLYDIYPGDCGAKVIESAFELSRTAHELLTAIKTWASVPIMPEDNSEEYMDNLIADVINRTNHRVGMKLFFIWWTQVIAFKMTCDAISIPAPNDKRYFELLKKAKLLGDNMEIALQDLEAWKADNEHVVF